MKILIALLILLNASTFVQASQKHLTDKEISRIKLLKQSVADVDAKTVGQTIAEIEKSAHPEVALDIKEAMAKAYADIVKEENVQGVQRKEWLYSMVALNMAYFQFGGDKDSAGGTKNLNKLIRYKFKTYLPADIYNRPGFHTSIS